MGSPTHESPQPIAHQKTMGEDEEGNSPVRKQGTIGSKSPIRQLTMRKQGTMGSMTSGPGSPLKKKAVIQTTVAPGEEQPEKA